MVVEPAERSFRRGIEALEQGRGIEALALFEAAISLERKRGAAQPQARYLSYYGLCLGLEKDLLREGIRLCREAIALEFFNADLCWNLGRLQLLAGRRREAYSTLRKGLRLQPRHDGIIRELERMGRRRRPAVPFLERGHPVNVLLGKLKKKLPARPDAEDPEAEDRRSVPRLVAR